MVDYIPTPSRSGGRSRVRRVRMAGSPASAADALRASAVTRIEYGAAQVIDAGTRTVFPDRRSVRTRREVDTR